MSDHRERCLRSMAESIHDTLSRSDASLVARVMLEQTERFVAMITTAECQAFTHKEFAAFALSCAKRIASGPAA